MTTLRPIEGQPGLWRCPDTSQILNMRDFGPFEVTADMRRTRFVGLVLQDREMWLAEHWSVVIHPWVEVIPPSITVDLLVQDKFLVQDMPLFRIAEPLKRSADHDLEKRLANLEAHLGIVADGRTDGGKLGKEVIRSGCLVQARLNGSADDLGMLFEYTKHFLLCIRGMRSKAW